MMRSGKLGVVAATAVSLWGIVLLLASTSHSADERAGASRFLSHIQTGNPELKSIASLSFGPDGLLLVADPRRASLVAIDTQDRGPVVKLKQRIDDVYALLAGAMGTRANEVQIVDMTVNPASGKIYLAVLRKADRHPAIITIDADARVAHLELDEVLHVRVPFPTVAGTKLVNITDIAFAGDRVVFAGQCNEEFASKIYSVPLPLKHDGEGSVYSTETYHVAHGKLETRAPIQSFVPYEEDGKQYIVGAFACTPIVRFPLDDIQPGSVVRGASVVELGSGNRPLDMFTYEKDGKQWLITNTFRFHHERSMFGPSKWWGVRVAMDYLREKEAINEKAVRRNVKQPAGPKGIEIVDALFGAVQVAQLDNHQIIVLRADRETDSEEKLSLELAELP